MDIVKKYSQDDLTIIWKPAVCIHSEKCYKGLSQVFDPKRKPWIDPKAAEIDVIKAQIETCPSGALSYENQKTQHNMSDSNEVKVQIFENGPMMVHGPMTITHGSGETEVKDKPVAFCRCGSSSNKPFCDGNHKKVDFKG